MMEGALTSRSQAPSAPGKQLLGELLGELLRSTSDMAQRSPAGVLLDFKNAQVPLQSHHPSSQGRSSWLTPSPIAVPTAYPSDPVRIAGCTRLRQPARMQIHVGMQKRGCLNYR